MFLSNLSPSSGRLRFLVVGYRLSDHTTILDNNLNPQSKFFSNCDNYLIQATIRAVLHQFFLRSSSDRFKHLCQQCPPRFLKFPDDAFQVSHALCDRGRYPRLDVSTGCMAIPAKNVCSD